ncbi:MAG: hypothetical protein KKI12_11450 [Proteobacteria bacterium]|nr:hypothetical protein [Pseudomonadota bacterium]MBU4259084.1 hypothetical protein [Pseudomonadota bacterium]MBU4288770.1 hypothetical protein [Pseudomonadota bacterium]
MLGQNFPISDYYRENIIDAVTISRSGGWWTAVLAIKDPKTNAPLISLYRWQQTEQGWKMRNRFHLRNKEQILNILKVVQDFSTKLDLPDK